MTMICACRCPAPGCRGCACSASERESHFRSRRSSRRAHWRQRQPPPNRGPNRPRTPGRCGTGRIPSRGSRRSRRRDPYPPGKRPRADRPAELRAAGHHDLGRLPGKIPGTKWADPAKKGSVENFKGALVLVDYPNQPFVVTQPAQLHHLRQPDHGQRRARGRRCRSSTRTSSTRPSKLNRGHTIHEYWMEDSGGRYGIDLKAFGAVPDAGQEPRVRHRGEHPGRRAAAPPATPATATSAPTPAPRGAPTSATTCANAVRLRVPPQRRPGRVVDLAGVRRDEVRHQGGGHRRVRPAGPGAAELEQRPATSPWTSWQASSNIWPNAGGGSSIAGRELRHGTYAHEFSHILGIGDNYNNPYAMPARRDYTGPWDMLTAARSTAPAARTAAG